MDREKKAEHRPLTVQEAGRLGGRKGGLVTASRHGMAEIGRLGGEAVRDRYGHDFYVAIGRKGGGKLKVLHAAVRALCGSPDDPACLEALRQAALLFRKPKADWGTP